MKQVREVITPHGDLGSKTKWLKLSQVNELMNIIRSNERVTIITKQISISKYNQTFKNEKTTHNNGAKTPDSRGR